MKLKCPACGAPIPAAGINVQQMVAVCSECDNIFKFNDIFTRKRKLKAPAQFRVADNDPDRLDMAFKWSWRTEPPFALLVVIVAFAVSLVTVLGMMIEGAPLAPMLISLAPTAFLSYILLTLALNSTHYESDGEMLNVYTEPLPYFRYGRKTFAVDEIDHVTVERYGIFPEGKAGFYNVYVHTLDGDKMRVAAVVNYEHAYFIAQELEAYVRTLPEIPTARISSDQQDEADIEHLDNLPEELPRKLTRS